MDEYREVVSDVIRTASGGEAWIEMNLAGYLTQRCTGRGTDEPVAAMAPALQWLAEHAAVCGQRAAGR
ncbi:hypothetical protein ACQEVZ_24600 [Dactylosporangium sp. CA-152071]|uniref:hypothetical protein n=1 Tax=Dactylosporangium sp. CA-152071 TaxID=3239933 RepID=UPI003D8C1ED6